MLALRFRMAILSLILMGAPASAVTVGFDCLTGNLAGNCTIGSAQISVDVIDLGGNQVEFTFNNVGPDASNIAEIYFDDGTVTGGGTLLGIASVIDGAGVDFEQGANPPNLPGAMNADPSFQVTAGFLAEAQPPPARNGVGPGEFVRIIFDLNAGGDYQDVIDELTSGDFRIGIHVTAFDSGGSESFINTPVPEPGTGALLAFGLVAVAMRRRV